MRMKQGSKGHYNMVDTENVMNDSVRTVGEPKYSSTARGRRFRPHVIDALLVDGKKPSTYRNVIVP